MSASRIDAMTGAARALGESLTGWGAGARLLDELSARSNLLTPGERRGIAVIPPRRGTGSALESALREDLGLPPTVVFREFSPQPSASSLVYEVHRAVLADGAPVFVRFARPFDPARATGNRHVWRDVRSALGERAPGGFRRLCRELPAVGAVLDEREPDLRDEAEALEALARNGRRTADVTVPRVRREATGRRFLAIEDPGASTVEECLARSGSAAARVASRTLGLGWLGQVFAGGAFPCACGSTELAFTDAGALLFLGGELRRLPRHRARALSDFLAFLAEDDPERAAEALGPALEGRGGDLGRWRRSLRQGSPFLDGGWNEHEEWLAPKALLAWRWICELGFRLDRETEGFFRGLARLSLIAERLSPDTDAIGEAHLEVRTRIATRGLRALASPLVATTAAATLADASIALPTAVERALLSSSSPRIGRTESDEPSFPGSTRSLWTDIGSALAAGGGILLAVDRLAALPGWQIAAAPIGFGWMLALGVALLVSIRRRG